MRRQIFDFNHLSAARTDSGTRRSENQDEIIHCPEFGFFAVSDGMGGLSGGGETSALIAKSLPIFVRSSYKELEKNPTPEYATALLDKQIRTLSNNIYEKMNIGERIMFGATLCGVWLVGHHVVFFNLGDSRGYLLEHKKNHIRQITADHTTAAKLVARGEISREEAQLHHSRNSLSRFAGMKSPAVPELFIEQIEPGDRILICSDGLFSMVHDVALTQILCSLKSPDQVVNSLIDAANNSGGIDNISVVYIQIIASEQ